jgi:hypothetical protein
VYNTWNDVGTFSGIIIGVIIGSMIIGLPSGYAISDAKDNGWKFRLPWSTTTSANEMLLKKVIIAPIQR